MKFRMIVKERDTDREPWHEDEDQTHITSREGAEAWARQVIENFNSSLREYEVPRELVRVEILDLEGDSHDWKKTNPATIIDKDGVYDTMECSQCGITGKRHGLSAFPRRDREFAAPGYDSCKQAKILLERRKKRRDKKNLEVNDDTQPTTRET